MPGTCERHPTSRVPPLTHGPGYQACIYQMAAPEVFR